jgi:hypothetical protein
VEILGGLLTAAGAGVGVLGVGEEPLSRDPNPYEVTEPELLRGLRLSWRGSFLQDRP